MESIGLATYSIRVQPAIGTDDLRTDSFAQGQDLLHTARSYMQARIGTLEVFRDAQRALLVVHFREQGRSLSGVMRKGEYGSQSPLVNIRTRQVTHQKSALEAEMRPYYFLIAIPPRSTLAVVALQTTGVIGIKGEFERDFADFFKEQHPDHKIRIDRLVTDQIIEQYLRQGRVTKVRLVNLRVPTDAADVYGTGLAQDQVDTEFIIRAKYGLAMDIRDRVRQVIRGDRPVARIVELRGQEFETAKLEIDIGANKYVTFDLSDRDALRSRFDLSMVPLGQDNYPDFAPTDAVARRIIADILVSLELDADDVR